MPSDLQHIDPLRIREIQLHPDQYKKLCELVPVSDGTPDNCARRFGINVSESALVPIWVMMVTLDDGSCVPVPIARVRKSSIERNEKQTMHEKKQNEGLTEGDQS